MSLFAQVKLAPPIEVFQLTRDYQADTSSIKADLGVGAYRTDEGKPWILPVVKKVEQKLAVDIEVEKINHEYLPVLGFERFTTASTRILLGEDCPAIKEGRAFGTQAISGTGALKNGAEFLSQHLGATVCLISDPTWGNHGMIFNGSGFKDIRKYPYWNKETRSLDFDGMINELKKAPDGSVVVLHACAHNPTGVDPTQEQWKIIADVCEEKKHFPFFDCAYQGFASGSLETDAWAVRYFVNERNFEVFVAQSFSKNFGLYNERAGNLTVVLSDASFVSSVKSQLTIIIRTMYSNPPAHGCRIVEAVLNDPALFDEWKDNIQTMAGRIINMRSQLRSKLEELGTPGNWNHITDQIGMFSFTGVSPEACAYLVKEKHIYLLKNSRISMCGVTPSNVEYLAQSINEAVTKFP